MADSKDLLIIQRDLGMALGSTSNMQEALSIILDAALKIYEFDCGDIYLRSRAFGDWRKLCQQGLSAEFIRSAGYYKDDFFRVNFLEKGKLLYKPYSEMTSSNDLDYLNEGIKSLIIVPVLHKGEAIASLNIASHSSECISPESRNAVEAIATHIAGVIARLQAKEELYRINRVLKISSESNKLIAGARNEKFLLENICKNIVCIGGYKGAWVGYKKEDIDKNVYPVAQYGFKKRYTRNLQITWTDNEWGNGAVGKAIRTGKSNIVRNTSSDPCFTPWREIASEMGYLSVIAVPLSINNELIGAITIYASEADAFNEQEKELLVEMTDNLAYGIELLRIRAEKKRGAEKLQYRLRIEKSIESIARLFLVSGEADFQKVLEYIGKTIEVEQAYIFEFQENENRLNNTHVWYNAETLYEEVQDINTSKTPGLIKKLKKGEEIILRGINDGVQTSFKEIEYCLKQNIYPFVMIPIRSAEGMLTGCIGLGKTKENRKWNEEDIEDLKIIAEIIAIYGERKKDELRIACQNQELHDNYKKIQVMNEEIKASYNQVTAMNQEIQESEKMIHNSYQQLKRVLRETVTALSSTMEIRDPYTYRHQCRVADLATLIAKELGMSNENIEAIHISGVLHDIGKIYVPAEILNKPGKLSDLEFKLIKTHSRVGYNIVKPVEFPWPIADAIWQHHERLNGKGYPQGLSGDNICLEAKILAVADVVEAMASHRPYREALGLEAALKEIAENAGVLYEPEVVEACLQVFKKGFQFDYQ